MLPENLQQWLERIYMPNSLAQSNVLSKRHDAGIFNSSDMSQLHKME